MVEAANKQGTQIIWTVCHYGWPDDLDIFSTEFIHRFERFCTTIARFRATHGDDDVPFYTPINEISFLAWAAGYKGYIHPHARDRALELKRQLVRAAITGMEAIWAVQPNARFVHVDPLVHVVTPKAKPEKAQAAAAQREGQFQSWDMLAGRCCPELGGQDKYLDIMGLNFYHSNEWEHPDDRLRWEDNPRDPRWIPLHRLLEEVYLRYRRPLFLAETSHFGVGRGPWIREIAEEICATLKIGVPLEGVCIYPILDRPDWENLNHWHNSGLWDLVPDNGILRRVLNEPYAADLRWAQNFVAESVKADRAA